MNKMTRFFLVTILSISAAQMSKAAQWIAFCRDGSKKNISADGYDEATIKGRRACEISSSFQYVATV